MVHVLSPGDDLRTPPVTELAALELLSTAGTAERREALWRVAVHPVRAGVVTRSVSVAYRPAQPTADVDEHVLRELREHAQPWVGDERWTPDLDIWPVWEKPAVSQDSAHPPLEAVYEHASTDGDRLRDSAKWMATAIGLALAALLGTSPLAAMAAAEPTSGDVLLGFAGLALVAVALMLVLRVMRPAPMSYQDVQAARHGPVARWRETVETEQDLYLPCGVKCLQTLRQSMIVDELTCNVLMCAINCESTSTEQKAVLERALAGRVRRLSELRAAAGGIVSIGGFHRLQQRSAVASYVGGACGVLGTACVIAAFLPTPALG